MCPAQLRDLDQITPLPQSLHFFRHHLETIPVSWVGWGSGERIQAVLSTVLVLVPGEAEMSVHFPSLFSPCDSTRGKP